MQRRDYKDDFIRRSNTFFEALRTDRIEDLNEGEIHALQDSIITEFCQKIPKIIEDLKSSNVNEVIQSINLLISFSNFDPKDEVFRLLLEKDAFDAVLSLNDTIVDDFIYEFFKNSIFVGPDMMITLMQRGLLKFCMGKIFNDDKNAAIRRNIVLHMITSSFFSRAILYSTGIVQNIFQYIQFEADPNIYLFAAKILFLFITEGPTYGQLPNIEEYRNPIEISRAIGMFHEFNQNALDISFSEELFCEFVDVGILFNQSQPFYDLILYLLQSENQPVLKNVFHTIKILIDRDNTMANPSYYEYFVDETIPYFDTFSRFQLEQYREIWDCYFKLWTSITAPLSEINQIILDDLLTFSFSVLDLEYAPDEVLIPIAHMLTNIIACNNGIYSKKIISKKRIKGIYSLMVHGSFKTQQAFVWLFLNLCLYTDMTLLDSKQINNVVSFLAYDTEPDLVIHILYTFGEIIRKQEKNGDNEGRSIVELFEQADGFQYLDDLLISPVFEVAEAAKAFDLEFNSPIDPEFMDYMK